MNSFIEKQIRVYNIQGKLVQAFEIVDFQQGFELSTLNWAEGLYIIQIQRGAEWLSKKLLVQRD